MRREPHENVATVLVEPSALFDLEVAAMDRDLRVWPVATAPICADGTRTAYQIRRRLVMKHQGEWDLAADWVPVWIGFGASWHDGAEPLPWSAHEVLWRMLDGFAEQVRYHRRLGGVARLPLPRDQRIA